MQRPAFAFVLAILWLPMSARAEVRLPAVISDHMVVQAGAKVTIWGWADAGETVEVALAGQSHKATADDAGAWSVSLEPLAAGGPHTLTVTGKNAITVGDVLVGEVWLGSGQSNMAMRVSAARDFSTEQEKADISKLRMFTESSGAAKQPQTVGKGQWIVCTPQTVGSFSATLYFFGRELHAALDSPVGLINSSVGGTPIEAWIRPEAQRESAELAPFFADLERQIAAFDEAAARANYEKSLAAWKEAVAKAKAEGKPRPTAPRDPVAIMNRRKDVGGLFNGKIAPLVPYTLRGVLWYQGEANTSGKGPAWYEAQLKLLVTDWRARWGRADLPFAWVQLPNFEGRGRDFPTVREAMRKSLALPNTGMAMTIDIGEPRDIHPKNKQDVGRRLAAWALGTVYGRDVVPSGPLPLKAEVSGGEVRVRFRFADGLTSRDGPPAGFEIAGTDGAWHAATARIDGESVVASSPDVPEPATVRYAWANNPQCNLFNAAGLPASPFRVDVQRP